MRLLLTGSSVMVNVGKPGYFVAPPPFEFVKQYIGVFWERVLHALFKADVVRFSDGLGDLARLAEWPLPGKSVLTISVLLDR
jgi:hypothetical protein